MSLQIFNPMVRNVAFVLILPRLFMSLSRCVAVPRAFLGQCTISECPKTGNTLLKEFYLTQQIHVPMIKPNTLNCIVRAVSEYT